MGRNTVGAFPEHIILPQILIQATGKGESDSQAFLGYGMMGNLFWILVLAKWSND